MKTIFAISWFVSCGFSRCQNQSRQRWGFSHQEPTPKTTNTNQRHPLAFPHTDWEVAIGGRRDGWGQSGCNRRPHKIGLMNSNVVKMLILY